MLTGREPCFAADTSTPACERHEVPHRKTHPHMPKTEGTVERFDGQVRREVPGIMIHGDIVDLTWK
jgi:hypothetical protein